MIKLFSTTLIMMAVCSTRASDSKVAQEPCLSRASLEIHQTYRSDNITLAKETLSVLFPNKDYVSVSCLSEPMPDQNPYSGSYTMHDSICLYKLKDHQAEQYYNYLKTQITQHMTTQQQIAKRAQRKRKQTVFHSRMLRTRTRYNLR